MQRGLRELVRHSEVCESMQALQQRHGGCGSSSAHDSPGTPMMLDAAPLGAALQVGFGHVALPPPQRAPAVAYAAASLQERSHPQQLPQQAQGCAARDKLGRAGLPALPPQARRAHGIARAPQHRRSSPAQPLLQLPAGHGPVSPARRQGVTLYSGTCNGSDS